MDTQGTSKEEEPFGIFRCCACHQYRAMNDVRIIPRAEPFLSMFLMDITEANNFCEWVKENVETLNRNEQLAICTEHLRSGNSKERMKIRGSTSSYAVRCPNFKAVSELQYPIQEQFATFSSARRTVRTKVMLKPVQIPPLQQTTTRPNLLPVKMMTPSAATLNSRKRRLPGLYDRKPQLPTKDVPKKNTSPVYVNIEPTPYYSPMRITEFTIPTSVMDNRLTNIIQRLKEKLNDIEKQRLFEAVVAMVYDKSGITTEEFANEFQIDAALLSSVALEVIAFFEKEKPGAKVDQREYAPPALYVPLKTREDWTDLYDFCFKNINEKSFVFKLGIYEKVRIANGCVESVLCGTQPQVAHRKYLIQYDRGVFTQFISQLTNSKNLQPGFLQCVTRRGYLFAPNKGIVKEAKVIVDYNAKNHDVKYEEDTIQLITFDVAMQAIRSYNIDNNSSDSILELLDFCGSEEELSKEMENILNNFGVSKIIRINVIKAVMDYYRDPAKSLEEVCVTESLDWNVFWFFLRVLRTFLNLDTFYTDEDQKLNGQIFKCRHPFRLYKHLLFQLCEFDNLDSYLVGTEPPLCWESSAAQNDEYLQYNDDVKASEYLMDGSQHYQISDSLCPVDLYSDIPAYNEPSSSGLNTNLYQGEHVSYVYDHDPTQTYNNVTNLL